MERTGTGAGRRTVLDAGALVAGAACASDNCYSKGLVLNVTSNSVILVHHNDPHGRPAMHGKPMT